MDPAITAAIIGVAGPVLTVLVTRWLEQRTLGKIEGRRKALVGSWRGHLWQVVEPGAEPLQMPVTVKFTSRSKKIHGTAGFSPPDLRPRDLEFTGGFFHEQFVKLEYYTLDPAIMQFGCFVARLDVTEDGATLDGYYVGYGPHTKSIVHGKAILNKDPGSG